MRQSWRVGLGVLASTGWIGQAGAQAAPPAGTVVELPTIEIVQTTPLTGSGIDIAKVPAHDSVVTQGDIARRNSPNIEDTIPAERAGRHPEQPGRLTVPARSRVSRLRRLADLRAPRKAWRSIRTACASTSPLATSSTGTSYRPMAIRDIDVLPNNPVFGLNALGGAVSVTMKNGFTNPGGTFDIHGGSFGRHRLPASNMASRSGAIGRAISPSKVCTRMAGAIISEERVSYAAMVTSATRVS